MMKTLQNLFFPLKGDTKNFKKSVNQYNQWLNSHD